MTPEKKSRDIREPAKTQPLDMYKACFGEAEKAYQAGEWARARELFVFCLEIKPGEEKATERLKELNENLGGAS